MEAYLQRFLDAQASCYPQVIRELRQGRKTSHWMWFIFPQLQGLGHSPMAQRYALPDLAMAQAYLDHPTLGVRLRECCDLLLAHKGANISQILGSPDDLKLRSCLTLFSNTDTDYAGFDELLRAFYPGQDCQFTLRALYG